MEHTKNKSGREEEGALISAIDFDCSNVRLHANRLRSKLRHKALWRLAMFRSGHRWRLHPRVGLKTRADSREREREKST